MPFISGCREMGIRVCAPLTVVKGRQLIAYELSGADNELVAGYCGIPEPNPALCARVQPAEIDTVIVPGSVFDEQGGRMGYGGGYYDRFLANQAPGATRVGIAFELQIRPYLPLQPHDQRLHCLVTEGRVLDF